jgi:hypothetical protein
MKHVDMTWDDIPEEAYELMDERSFLTDSTDDLDSLLEKFDDLLKKFGLEIVDYNIGAPAWCIGIEPVAKALEDNRNKPSF